MMASQDSMNVSASSIAPPAMGRLIVGVTVVSVLLLLGATVGSVGRSKALYEFYDGEGTVYFPGKPSVEVDEMEDSLGLGLKWVHNVFSFEHADYTMIVTYQRDTNHLSPRTSEAENEKLEIAYAGWREMMSGVDVVVAGREAIRHHGYPGWESLLIHDRWMGKTRIVASHDRFVALTYQQDNDVEYDKDLEEEFLDSLEIDFQY